MPAKGASPFATFLIVGPTCFFLGMLLAQFPYDYNVLWSQPPVIETGVDPRAIFFDLQETHLKFLHASPPLISRILHIVIGVGILGFMLKLFKPTEANLLFDGASLVLYMCGITVYIANIVKGLRTVTHGAYGTMKLDERKEAISEGTLEGRGAEYIGREDSLRVLSASNTILALVLVGVLILQAGQWYAERKETEEIAELDKKHEEKLKAKADAKAGGKDGKKKQ